MNLAIDIGNSLVKAAVFDKGQAVETFRSKTADKDFFDVIFETYPDIESIILVTSGPEADDVAELLSMRSTRFIRFGADTPLPVKNLYGTPETLGCDRLAAAVGAHALYPDNNVLIVDFGTAITIDVVSAAGEFLGGNISPGAMTRFRALHEYTSKLPLRSLADETKLIADNSNQAVESGVINGIVYEIEGYIARLSEKYDDLKIIFTGGDSNFFAKRLKNTIFATYDLVVYGLNRILEYNAK